MSDFKGRVSTLTTARLTASSLIPPRESRLPVHENVGQGPLFLPHRIAVSMVYAAELTS